MFTSATCSSAHYAARKLCQVPRANFDEKDSSIQTEDSLSLHFCGLCLVTAGVESKEHDQGQQPC